MIITGRQLAAARSLINISQEELAKKAGVGRITIARFENEDTEPRTHIVESLKMTLESLGVEFKDGGVLPKKSKVTELIGGDCFIKLLEMVLKTIQKDEEVLFFCSNDRESPPQVNELLHQLRLKGVKMRNLVEEDDLYLMGELKEYRYLPKQYFRNDVLVVYQKYTASILAKTTQIVIIEDIGLATSLKNIFEIMWSAAPKATRTIANEHY